MATDELHDNNGDANQIHTNEALGSGKIKVALVDQYTNGLTSSVTAVGQTADNSYTQLKVVSDASGHIHYIVFEYNNYVKVQIEASYNSRVFTIDFGKPADYHEFTLKMPK